MSAADDNVVYVEVTYEDGTVARWVIPADDERIERIEAVLGNPDTLAL